MLTITRPADWMDGKRHGHGEEWLSDGSHYVGEFVNDQRHGPGILIEANDARFEGVWVHDQRSQGIYACERYTYVGTFLDNLVCV